MNKQPRMIDADKLLVWIELTHESKLPAGSHGLGIKEALRAVKRHIGNGTFDPDPIPLPTIKPYKCSNCKETSPRDEWNKKTIEYYGGYDQIDDIILLGEDEEEGDTFICPVCGEEQPRHMVEVIPNE